MWEKQERHSVKNKGWLESGGADIVMEVIRRTGWTVDVGDTEEWDFLPNIVAIGNRNPNIADIWINGEKPPWLQAVAAVSIAETYFKRFSEEECRPIFYDDEKLDELEVYGINEFIDRIRYASEIAISLAGTMVPGARIGGRRKS